MIIFFVSSCAQDFVKLPGSRSRDVKIGIINDVSGIIKPGR